ncbi:unnamed protein product [Dovyalis caffra]|uniref:Uncharacterized protein n=1 Tax=Dovyalis caffra TaxID=77055 RepID=A0AAV1RRW6_9ROSI|nr:unnamed protein product [Dovyalis caffra]
MKCNEEDTCKPNSSSCKDVIIDKENVTVDKPNMPKLNLEPQQMKRKKYNLRKSLAWDRAFFTEEGVLDPSELSTLSRNVGGPVFHEGRELRSGGLDCISELPDLQALEDNLFKELSPDTLNEGGMAAVFSPKPALLAGDEAGPASVAKRKVLSASNISQSAPKRSGCPRLVASSSYPLAPKPDPSDVSMAPRSGRLKRNQIPYPGNGQKNSRLKGTSTNTGTARKDMKLGPSDKSGAKSTAHHAISKVSAVTKVHSSTNAHLQVNQAINRSEVIPGLVLPAAAHPLNGCDGSTSKIAVSLSQNAFCNSGNVQYTQSQTAKPSCLRMPSPSLGFFSQSKTSGSLSLLERTQAGKLQASNIPSLHKAGLSNGQCPPKPSKKTSAFSRTGRGASAVNPTSHGKIKCNSELNNKEKMAQAPHNSKAYDELNNQQQLLDIHANQLLLHGCPGEQLKKGERSEKVNGFCLKGRDTTADGLDYPHSVFNASLVAEVDGLSEENSMTANHHIEDRKYIPIIKDNSDYSDFPSLGMSGNSEEGTTKVYDELSWTQEVNNQNAKQTELMKLDTQLYPVSNAESLSLCLNNSTSIKDRSSEELNKYRSSNSPNAILKTQDCSAGELKIPFSPSCCNDILYTVNDTSGIGNLYKDLHAGDAKMQSVDDNLLVERGEKSTLNALAVDNLPLMIIGDPSEKTAEKQTELPFPCLVTEQASEDDCRLHYDGYLLHGRRFSSEESKEKNLLQSGKDMGLNVNTSGGELESSSVLSSKSPTKHDSSSTAVGTSECLHVENPLVASVDRGIVKVASGINDSSGDEGLVDKCESSLKNFMVSSYLQPGNDANARVSSVLENSCSTCIHHVNKDVEKTEVMTSFCESDQENQSQRAFDDILYTKSRSYEDQWKFSDSNIANIRGTTASEVESLNGIHQCEIMDQTNELVQINRMTEETGTQNAQVLSFDYNLLRDGHKSNISPSVANRTSPVLVDDIREQPEEHFAVRNPYLMIEQASLENHEFCSDGNLLLMDNASVELRKEDALQNVLGVGLEQGDGLCESRCYDVGTQVPPVIKDAGSDVDKNAEHAFMVDREPGFIETLPAVENRKCSMDGKNRRDGKMIDEATSLEPNSFSVKSRHQISSPADNCDSKLFCSLNEKSKSLVRKKEKPIRRIQQGAEADISNSNILPEEAQIKVPETSSGISKELQHELNVMYPTEDEDATLSLQKPVNNKKQDASVIKPLRILVPFSDEWLAAFEDAGEEILTMKGGAVQNSPPDKFEHEPGPWSPVRRKNAQGIGPFDCTKFTNNNIPPSTSD